MELKHTVFAINAGERFMGYTAGQHWNGWACPYFTKPEADRIMDMVNRTSPDIKQYFMRYDDDRDVYIYHDDNCDEAETFACEQYLDQKTGEIYELYAIGSWSWIWDDLMEGMPGNMTVKVSK